MDLKSPINDKNMFVPTQTTKATIADDSLAKGEQFLKRLDLIDVSKEIHYEKSPLGKHAPCFNFYLYILVCLRL